MVSLEVLVIVDWVRPFARHEVSELDVHHLPLEFPLQIEAIHHLASEFVLRGLTLGCRDHTSIVCADLECWKGALESLNNVLFDPLEGLGRDLILSI